MWAATVQLSNHTDHFVAPNLSITDDVRNIFLFMILLTSTILYQNMSTVYGV